MHLRRSRKPLATQGNQVHVYEIMERTTGRYWLLQPWNRSHDCACAASNILSIDDISPRDINHTMIQGFSCRRTQRLWVEREAGRFPPDLATRALAKLAQLDAAGRLEDLRIPPSNQLEALKGDRKGQHSIRVNGQWRLCFLWAAAGPSHIELIDYH